jgi:hypothetical protein
VPRDRRVLGWLGVGLALRVALMPFAVSADLLAVYWRAHLIAFHGQVFDSYLVNMGAHYVHALSLRVFGFLLPPPEQVWTHPWWWADSSALAPQLQRAFSADPRVFTTLFALKLPYLLADLAAGFVLLALARTAAASARRRAWAFWMLSPIGLYATYVFGRYEAFAVLAVVAALWACERDRPWLGALALGVGITMRSYPLLLVPVFAFLAVRGVWRSAAWAGLALAPFAVVMATNRLLADTVGELTRLRDFSTGATFFAYTLPVDGQGDLYVFVLFAFAVYGWLLGRALRWWGRAPDVGELWLWLLVFSAGMFAFATFSAHYFMWFTPFVALAVARRPAWRGVLALHLLQVVVVLAIADVLGGPGTLLGLFQPVAPGVAEAAPSLRTALLGAPELATQLLGLLRTGFVALTALLVWPALAELARPGTSRQVERGERERAPEQREPRERERGRVPQPLEPAP